MHNVVRPSLQKEGGKVGIRWVGLGRGGVFFVTLNTKKSGNNRLYWCWERIVRD